MVTPLFLQDGRASCQRAVVEYPWVQNSLDMSTRLAAHEE
jgi:hypothetical protein